MKRLFLTSVLLVLIFFSSQGQNFNLGLKAGFNFSSLPAEVTGTTPDLSLTAFADAYTGYHVGAMAIYVFRGGFIQPELLFTRTGRDMQLEYTNPQQEEKYFTQEYSHLVLPIYGGAKLGSLKIGAGPVFSYLVNDWNDLGIEEDFEQELQKLTVGYHLGAGLQLGNLMLDFKYQGSLTKFGDGVTLGGQNINFDTRPKQFILSLGLLF